MQNKLGTMNFAANIFYWFFMLVVEQILVVKNWLLRLVNFVRKFWTRREDLPQLLEESSLETHIKVEDLLMLTSSSMERLGDDELFSIFTQIHNPNDRIVFAQVSKQFLKVACNRLIKLQNLFPDFLYDILPKSPNLISFTCSKPISNTHIQLVAQSCPKLQVLNLGLDQKFDFHVESNGKRTGSTSYRHLYGKLDFDDEGLCAIANACCHLREVVLRKRLHVGDVGVVTLVINCSKSLSILDLWGCVNLTNKSLEAIGKSKLRCLSLQGCHLMTNLGLKYLANGKVSNHLIEIVLAECDGITDAGIINLTQGRFRPFVIRSKKTTQGILEGFGSSFHDQNDLTCVPASGIDFDLS